MSDTLWLILAFIPVLFFWIFMKIMRIKLYVYRRQKYPEEHKSIYRTMDPYYLRDLFINPHKKDKRYTQLVKRNRIVFFIFAIIFALTIYIVVLYLR